MTEAASTKFNLPKTTTYIIMPLAFTGKDKRFEGLTNAYQFMLAEIYTANRAVKGYAKLTFAHFVQKFGMSKETICNGIRKIEELGIIKRLGNSRYKILLKFNTKDYIIIDDYLYKKLWNVNGKEKSLAYSRIKTLAFLHRENSNPKTAGVFVSSQARIGVAVHLPKSTAGDCIRELSAIGVINLKQANTNFKEAYKRGLTRFTVHPELLVVKRCKPTPPPDDVQKVKELFKQHDKKAPRRQGILAQWQTVFEKLEAEELAKQEAERKVKAFDVQLMQDETYKQLKQHLKACKSAHTTAIISRDNEYQERTERKLTEAKEAFTTYLKAHSVPPDIFEALIQY